MTLAATPTFPQLCISRILHSVRLMNSPRVWPAMGELPNSSMSGAARQGYGEQFPNRVLPAQVFADQRYQRHDKRDKLPGWITSHLKDAHLNLSTDMLMHIARDFMRSMAQPYDGLAIGKSLLTEAQANAFSPGAAT